MTGGHWGGIAKGAYTLAVYIHTERLKAISRTPNQCNRLSANSKGGKVGKQSHGCFESLKQRRNKRKETKVIGKEEEKDRREVMTSSWGGGLAPGWCGWWSPGSGRVGHEDGVSGVGGCYLSALSRC